MNPATLGTPCLVPVQVDVEGGGRCRGFITRLAPDSAAVSSDPPLVVGAQVRLEFRSPVTGELVTASGQVREALDEGGLWRGRSAALVMLASSLEADVLGPAGAGPRKEPQRRGSEAGPASLNFPPAAGMSGTLQAGLGRRRRTSASPVPVVPAAAPPPPPDHPPPESDRWTVPDHLSDEHTAPPRGAWLTEPEVDPVGAFGFTGEEEVPPVRATDPELPKVSTPQPGAPPRDDSDDDFFGKFGQVEGIPDFMLPQGAEDSAQLGVHPEMTAFADDANPDASSDHVDDDGYFDPARSGKIEVAPTRNDLRSLGGLGAVAPGGRDLPSKAEMDSAEHYDAILNTSEHEPNPSLLSDAPPVRNTMSIGEGAAPMAAPGGASPPWEAEAPRRIDESLIPRNARIASSLPVSFWARGRSNTAVAQNFSKEGLYLAYSDPPPVRGAIVRIEFPVEGDGEPVPVRFNAEVRWQSSDRPGSGLPEGFGVQILTFESPKDRRRYDELLLLILSLHHQQSKRENEQEGTKWSWENGSRS